MEKYKGMTDDQLKELARSIFGNAVNVDLLGRDSLIEKLKNWDAYVEKNRGLTGFTGGNGGEHK